MTITDAIAKALYECFGDNYEIYTENVEQGLKEPCFFIETVEKSGGQYLGGKYRRDSSFCIHYFPVSGEPGAECEEVVEKLFWLLECIPFQDGLIRGTDLCGKVDDSVLHFFVDYNRFILKLPDAESMGKVEIEVESKGKGEGNC